MSWILSLLIALLSALVSAFGAGAVGARCVNWYCLSNREGGATYFLAFVTMGGALLGFGIGGIAARMMATGAGSDFLKILSVGAGCDVAVLGVVALICWRLADLPTKVAGQSVVLQGEIRCPVEDGGAKTELDFEKVELANLSADSPLEQCLKFTHYSQPEERRLMAGKILGRRRNLVAEMTAQILSPDAVMSDEHCALFRSFGHCRSN